MIQREPKQSLLDYLWVNFGERGVVTSPDSANSDSIPSYGLIQKLLKEISSNAIGSITEKEGVLIIKSLDGITIDTITLPTSILVSDFGRRTITKEDIEKGSPYLLYLPVYYLLLNTGIEFIAPIDVYKGSESKVIKTEVIDLTIYSDLKISSNIKGLVFTKEEDGLSGYVLLRGSTQGILFEVMNEYDYNHSIHNPNTLYFIEGKPYVYFRETKIGNNTTEDFTLIEERLSKLEFLTDWENHG